VKLQKHSSPLLMKLLMKLFFQKTALLVKLSCAKQDLSLTCFIFLCAVSFSSIWIDLFLDAEFVQGVSCDLFNGLWYPNGNPHCSSSGLEKKMGAELELACLLGNLMFCYCSNCRAMLF
jgi:hypothetical protein